MKNTKKGSREVLSLVKGPRFGLGNQCDRYVADWVAKNCRSYDENARLIFEQLLKLCPRGKKLSPTISVILRLILLRPRRFTGKDKETYKAVLSLRARAPWAWDEFLKNAESVNKYDDWMQLFHDFGYDGPIDLWDPTYYKYVKEKLEQTAKH